MVRRRELTGDQQRAAMRCGVAVGGVGLELQNQVQKQCEPLAKLEAEGNEERPVRALANWL
jgi:hypothetical protein